MALSEMQLCGIAPADESLSHFTIVGQSECHALGLFRMGLMLKAPTPSLLHGDVLALLARCWKPAFIEVAANDLQMSDAGEIAARATRPASCADRASSRMVSVLFVISSGMTSHVVVESETLMFSIASSAVSLWDGATCEGSRIVKSLHRPVRLRGHRESEPAL